MGMWAHSTRSINFIYSSIAFCLPSNVSHYDSCYIVYGSPHIERQADREKRRYFFAHSTLKDIFAFACTHTHTREKFNDDKSTFSIFIHINFVGLCSNLINFFWISVHQTNLLSDSEYIYACNSCGYMKHELNRIKTSSNNIH